MILHGDCLHKLKELPDNSVDSVVTDPPYGLSFMGKKWDYDVPSVDVWREVLRVLKPGGHCLSFGGTRTYHRLVVAMEDAGFEIRDCIQWIYGSGFPKSMDVSKAIDKAAGAERVTNLVPTKPGNKPEQAGDIALGATGVRDVSSPITDDAKQWQGWGTALKPANEPICVARKPLSEKTVAKNVLKHGTGAINIDESRISGGKMDPRIGKNISYGLVTDPTKFGQIKDKKICGSLEGRWPANVIFDEVTGCAGWSRFFYVAKASKRERNAGLEGMRTKEVHRCGSGIGEGIDPSAPSKDKNFHPTVKPIKLMEYLIKLVTPPNGTVLDPFMGSGTTGVAAKKLGFNFIGIEMNEEYVAIAEKRIEAT